MTFQCSSVTSRIRRARIRRSCRSRSKASRPRCRRGCPGKSARTELEATPRPLRRDRARSPPAMPATRANTSRSPTPADAIADHLADEARDDDGGQTARPRRGRKPGSDDGEITRRESPPGWLRPPSSLRAPGTSPGNSRKLSKLLPELGRELVESLRFDGVLDLIVEPARPGTAAR